MRRLFQRFGRALRGEGRVLIKLGLYSLGCLVVLGWLISMVGNAAFFQDREGLIATLR